jgi:hypothetical protein
MDLVGMYYPPIALTGVKKNRRMGNKGHAHLRNAAFLFPKNRILNGRPDILSDRNGWDNLCRYHKQRWTTPLESSILTYC